MLSVIDLWIPILVSVVLVFVASSIIHMVLKTHHKDFRKLPGEDRILEVMRGQGVSPGAYNFPFCGDMKDMASEENKARFERGPVGLMNVWPNGLPNMGKALGLWALYLVLVSIFVAYITTVSLPPGADYLTTFRVAGASAFLPFVLANMPASIWYGQPWSTTFRFGIDGAVYSLLVAGTFAAFWPGG